MRTLIYSLQTTLMSLWHEKWINLLTILSISVSLLILSAFVTVTFNVDSLIDRWAKSFGLVVYLSRDASEEDEENLRNFFRNDTDIVHVRYISKEKALEELKAMLKRDTEIIEELGENPLPSSFELKLDSGLLKPEFVLRKSSQIEALSGVEEVQYGEKWLSSLNTLSRIMKISATFLGIAIFTAIAFITYNTIKVFFYRRKDEIETLKLLGATRSFIRLPFLIEGLIIGILGGAAGSLALFGFESFINLKSIEFLPSIRTIMFTLPGRIYTFIMFAGALMSTIGSFIAVGRIRY